MIAVAVRAVVGLVAFFATVLCLASIIYAAMRDGKMNGGDWASAGICAWVAAFAFLLLEVLE